MSNSHSHNHNHNYSHSHSDNQKNHSHDADAGNKSNQRTLLISFIIITGYMIVEALGGWITGSLALLSDAGHMLSDAIALGATLLAFKIGEKAATRDKTYGYKRFEILIAGVNGATLVIIALMIFYEAIMRFNHPPEIATKGMLIIATIGMLVNLLVAWLMHRGGSSHSHASEDAQGSNNQSHGQTSGNATQDNLNMRSAYLHVLSDLLGSVAAIIAALLMMSFGWQWADPVASVIVAALILRSGYRVVMDSVHILMEGTPAELSLVEIESALQSHHAVYAVHDLHVWSITSGLHALSCHVVVDGTMTIRESDGIIHELEHLLTDLGIQHATIQVESGEHQHSDALVCDISSQQVASNHHGHNH